MPIGKRWMACLGILLATGMLLAQDIFINANGDWNVPGNWSQGILPGTNSAAIGTNTVIATANVTDSQTCSNLYVGGNATLAGTGTLNINGGSLLVTGSLYIAGASGSSGTVTQTSGSMTNCGLVYASFSAGTSLWTVAGGTVVNLSNVSLTHFANGVGKLVVSGGVMSNAGNLYLGNNAKTVCTLIVTNSGILLLNGPGTSTLGSGPGGGCTNTVAQGGGVISSKGPITMGSIGSVGETGYTVWTMTGGAFTNTSTFGLGSSGTGTDTWTMTGGVFSNQGLITVCSKGSGTMNMNGGTLLAQGGFACVGTGAVVQTGGLIVSGGIINIGASAANSTGLWTMAGGVMTNYGSLYVGQGIQQGALVITNTGMWSQNGATAVGSYYAFSAWHPGTGAMTVANGGLFQSTNIVTVAVYGGSNAFGTLTISNATFISTNAGTAFIVGTNGVVLVCGTQRVFQVAALTNYSYGVYSNKIAQQAGGLDITSTNSFALSCSPNGSVTLVFSQDPVMTGHFWGLRWLGTNHVAALTALHNASPPQLTWDDSQLSTAYQGQVAIYADAVYTYVGVDISGAPVLATQPANQTVSLGGTATFGVTATGTTPLAYQWQKNASNIYGATGAVFTTWTTTNADNGDTFDVVVTNAFGSVTSSTAMLTVLTAINSQTNSGYGPTLNFSDLVSGPNTGNSDTSLGQIGGQDGAIVTVWGTGLGTSQGTSTVMACGALATNIYYWGNATSPYSASDMYTRHRMQMIIFQISHLASNGIGSISVNVNGQASTNTLPFTLTNGTIRFVSTTGNDATGNGSWSTAYRTIPKAVSNMAAGDITYVCDGVQQTTADANDNTTLELKRGGQAGSPMAIVGYPGATCLIGNTNIYFAVKDYNGNYPHWVFAKLQLRANTIALQYFNDFRLVGNLISAPCGTDPTGSIAGSGNDLFFLGNEMTQIGRYQCSKLYHPLYVSSARSTNTGHRLPAEANREIAWNYFHDNNANRAINMYSEDTATAFMSGHKVHHNFIINQVGGGILCGTYMTGTNWVYDNVVANVGLGPDPLGPAQAHFGVEFDCGVVATDAPSSTLYFYNNTICGCSWTNAQLGEAGCINFTSNNYALFFENNIILSTNQNIPYLGVNSTLPPLLTSKNNLWYGSGRPPSWDTNRVLNVDPSFVSPFPMYNFDLASNSPVIDAGALDVAAVVSVDFSNTPRPQGAGYDLGAYEYVATSNAPVISGTPLLIVTMSSNGMSSLGPGYYISVPVPLGYSTQIVYTACEWYRISTLASNGVAMPAATGSRFFTQTLANVSATVSNAVVFAMATPDQTGYTNVTTCWLTNWTEEAVQAALDCDGFSVYDKYLLGLDPTASNSYRLLFDTLSLSGSNVVIVVRRDVTGALSPDGMHGSLIVQGAASLSGGGFTNIPDTAITGSQVFNASGYKTYTNAINGATRYYKAIVP